MRGRAIVVLATVGAALALFCGAALAATIHCEEKRCDGTPRDGTLIGSTQQFEGEEGVRVFPYWEFIHGLAGDDTIRSRAGHDYLYGEGGNDHLIGGEDGATVYGGPGKDRMAAGFGEEFGFEPGWGHDTVYLAKGGGDPEPWKGSGFGFTEGSNAGLRIDLAPGRGPEVTDGRNTVEVSKGVFLRSAVGGNGNDAIRGNGRYNHLDGGPGDDTIVGLGGNDGWLAGGPGDDTVVGGEGDDEITLVVFNPPDGHEEDSAEGGRGDDYIESFDRLPDTIDCGEGQDEVYFDEGLDKVSSNCEVRKPGP